MNFRGCIDVHHDGNHGLETTLAPVAGFRRDETPKLARFVSLDGPYTVKPGHCKANMITYLTEVATGIRVAFQRQRHKLRPQGPQGSLKEGVATRTSSKGHGRHSAAASNSVQLNIFQDRDRTLSQAAQENGLQAIVLEQCVRLRTAELQMAKDLAESASSAKTAYIADISHEMRTAMSGVIGAADLLNTTSLDPTQLRYAELLQRSADALLVLLDKVLDLSKIEAEMVDFSHESFNPLEVLEQVAMQYG